MKVEVKKEERILERDVVKNAVKKLFGLLTPDKSAEGKKSKKTKVELFDEPERIQVNISAVKIPKSTKKFIEFQVPHSLLNDNSQVVLITKYQKDLDSYESNNAHYRELLDTQNIKGITHIMSFQELKSTHSETEMKVRFLNMYDLILAESSIYPYVLTTFGHLIEKKNKVLLCVKLNKSHLPGVKNAIEKALLTTQLRINVAGDCYSLSIAETGMKVDHIVDNIMAFSEQVDKKFPGGFLNINGLYLRTPKSAAVHFYMSGIEKEKVARPKRESLDLDADVVTGELSTILDGEVKVHPSGKVELINGEIPLGKKPNPANKFGQKKKSLGVKVKKSPIRKSSRQVVLATAASLATNSVRAPPKRQRQRPVKKEVPESKKTVTKKAVKVEKSEDKGASTDTVEVAKKKTTKVKKAPADVKEKATKRKVTETSTEVPKKKVMKKKSAIEAVVSEAGGEMNGKTSAKKKTIKASAKPTKQSAKSK